MDDLTCSRRNTSSRIEAVEPKRGHVTDGWVAHPTEFGAMDALTPDLAGLPVLGHA
jgi:hypothetical protein